MLSGRTDCIARMEPPGAAAAPVWHMINDSVYLLCWYQRSRVAWVAKLAAGLATALDPTTPHPLTTGETIRRGRFGRDGRILLSQRELPLQIFDLACLLGDLLRALFKLLTQTLVFAPQPLQLLDVTGGLFTSPSPWLLHWPERTELRQRVQAA
jgi:hypothetical protein